MKIHPKHRDRSVVLLILLLTLLAWLPVVDNMARAQVDAGLQRALVTFAAARTLNAAISVAQGTQTAVQPAGVGVILAPGQVLDPVNDLVEQFSQLMLIASASFGIQKILIDIGASWLISGLLTTVVVFWAWQKWAGRRVHWLLTRTLAVFLFIRFALPVAAIVSDAVFRLYMADSYLTSQHYIGNTSEQATDLAPPTETALEDPSMLERLRNWGRTVAAESPITQLREAAGRAIEHIIQLIVIFTLQTILLPIGILWLFLGVAKRAVASPRASSEQA